MKCSFCGNDVEPGAKYCPVCGTEVAPKDGSGGDQSASKYEDPNGQNGYGYGYGESGNSQGGYSYGQSDDSQGGYGYGQPNNEQPGNNYGQPNYGQPVKKISGTPYMIFSILTTLCCCLPLGIASIVYASKINSLQRMGDYAGAEAAAKKAKIFMIVGVIGGLIANVALGALGAFDAFSDFGKSTVVDIEEPDDADDVDDADDADDAAGKEKDKAPSKDVAVSGELGDSWNSFTVQVNDKVLTFPCTIEDVEATGLKLDTEDTPEDYVINVDDYELVFFDDGNYNSLMFMVCNNTEEAHPVRECTVNGIYVSDYDVEDGNITVVFPGGIQMGADIETVIGKWGETDDVYEGDGTDTYTWHDDSNYSYCSVSVDSETKKVTTIDLDGQYVK